jgi:hypothetical protein
VFRRTVGPIWRVSPTSQRRAGRADFGRDGILGKDGHRVTAFYETPGRAQFRRNIAVAIDDGKQIPAWFHRSLF